MRKPHFEEDNDTWNAAAYSVEGYRGVAWSVLGWELEYALSFDDVCETDEVRTGKVVCMMVGDDRRFTFDPAEVTALGDLDYCASCGQIGCGHDGRERD